MKKLQMRRAAIASVLLSSAIAQSGCMVVGGYSSRGGWFIWPGSLGLLLIVLVLFLVLRRR